jgi:hypothetical protein
MSLARIRSTLKRPDHVRIVCVADASGVQGWWLVEATCDDAAVCVGGYPSEAEANAVADQLRSLMALIIMRETEPLRIELESLKRDNEFERRKRERDASKRRALVICLVLVIGLAILATLMNVVVMMSGL